MTPENFQAFKTALTLAVEKHIADGGKIAAHIFYDADGKCVCPVACLMGPKPEDVDYQTRTSTVLGFEISIVEMYAFMDGFDGNKNWFPNQNQELFAFGQEIRSKYLGLMPGYLGEG